MALALLLRKEEHTPEDLRQLAEAPYFTVHLIRDGSAKPNGNRRRRRRYSRHISPEELSDDELAPAGTLLHSHGIAPSTRERFEEMVDSQLPTSDPEQPEKLMRSRKLHELLSSHPELHSDSTVGELYKLLKIASELRFRVGWYEGLEEITPKGWR